MMHKRSYCYCYWFAATSLFFRLVILKVGFTKQGQGFGKATFVKNSAVNFEHSCQSCKDIPRLHVERQSVFITLTLSNITSQNKDKGSVKLHS